MEPRIYWAKLLESIVNPVFESLAADRLREQMPLGGASDRAPFAHLEALGRSLAGLGPWLNLEEVDPEEEIRRSALLDKVVSSLEVAMDPASRDFMNFKTGNQPLVDAAFLAQGLLRSWERLWPRLPDLTRDRLTAAMLETRRILPGHCNWLLFSAIVEAFLYKAGADWDRMRIDYAIRQHEQWYVGDGAYSDGPSFHWDYYNSFVIQPMLYDLAHLGGEVSETWDAFKKPIARRIQRYAVIQERFIAPDGTFPPIGRSLVYRSGAFQVLALVVLKSGLPEEVSAASVRCALTAVLQRLFDRDDVFDKDGWLRAGLCGYQPSLAESYISTGSLYLCACGFLPLGLPESDPFWADRDADWTSRQIWKGIDTPADHACD